MCAVLEREGMESQVIFDSSQKLINCIFMIISHNMAQNCYFIKDFSPVYLIMYFVTK